MKTLRTLIASLLLLALALVVLPGCDGGNNVKAYPGSPKVAHSSPERATMDEIIIED